MNRKEINNIAPLFLIPLFFILFIYGIIITVINENKGMNLLCNKYNGIIYHGNCYLKDGSKIYTHEQFLKYNYIQEGFKNK